MDVAPERPAGKPCLLDRLRAEIRRLHYSRRTEKAYVGWVKRFILFHGKRHPVEMGKSRDHGISHVPRRSEKRQCFDRRRYDEEARSFQDQDQGTDRDRDRVRIAVALPFALDRKYPSASREWGWQWLFPATRTSSRVGHPARRPRRPSSRQYRQARGLPQPAPRLRHPPHRGRLRRALRPEAPRTQGSGADHDFRAPGPHLPLPRPKPPR